jgi:hypothetical protein
LFLLLLFHYWFLFFQRFQWYINKWIFASVFQVSLFPIHIYHPPLFHILHSLLLQRRQQLLKFLSIWYLAWSLILMIFVFKDHVCVWETFVVVRWLELWSLVLRGREIVGRRMGCEWVKWLAELMITISRGMLRNNCNSTWASW